MKLKKQEQDEGVAIERSIQEEKAVNYFIDKIIKPHPNHTIFEVNPIKKTISVAKFEDSKEVPLGNDWTINLQKAIIRDNDCFYISALNASSVAKKIARFGLVGYTHIKDEQFKKKGLVVSLTKIEKVT